MSNRNTVNYKSYCGDYPQLPASYDRMGSLKECLQKGIGVGKYLSTGEKEAIKVASQHRSSSRAEKVYCGNLPSIPPGYSEFGTRSRCLKIGVGIGARLEVSQEEQDIATIKKIASLLSIRVGRKGKQRLIDEIIFILRTK